MAEVRLENVTKYYGRKRAVEDVSFTCKEGGFLSIVGPTGAGKSTILKMVAGIESITSGRILFNGKLINDFPPQERNVSMAFESYNLYPHISVYDNIAFPLRAKRWGFNLSKDEEYAKVKEIASFLGIDEYLERLPQNLSGGQKQRVSLARALVRKPEVYLLDEPIAHLDARLKFSTQTLMKEFAQEYKSTIIYVTHDYREALALSDNLIVLRKGKVVQEGPPEEVYNYPRIPFVGRTIGEPPMNVINGDVNIKSGSMEFKAGDDFSFSDTGELSMKAEKLEEELEGSSKALVGIRSEHIRLGRKKISEISFKLPVYAITHESESSVITFRLSDGTFIYARVGQEEESDYEPSEEIWLDFDADKTFFYPVQSIDK